MEMNELLTRTRNLVLDITRYGCDYCSYEVGDESDFIPDSPEFWEDNLVRANLELRSSSEYPGAIDFFTMEVKDLEPHSIEGLQSMDALDLKMYADARSILEELQVLQEEWIEVEKPKDLESER